MKRFFTLLLALCLATGFTVGCDTKKAETKKTETTSTPEGKTTTETKTSTETSGQNPPPPAGS